MVLLRALALTLAILACHGFSVVPSIPQRSWLAGPKAGDMIGCGPVVRQPGSGQGVVREAWYVKREYYDELGVERGATEDEIRKAYRELAKTCQ